MISRFARILGWTLVVGLAACASDDGSGPEELPHEGTDRVTFRVFAPPADGTAKVDLVLRWKGNASGPDADSPEATDQPWVGYAQPFRVEWEAEFEDAPLVGYKARVSQAPDGQFLPRDAEGNSVFGNFTSWEFENSYSATSLEGQDCPGGTDCPGLVRFGSGTIRVDMVASNADGGLSDRVLGALEIAINYPPVTSFAFDDPACDDDTVFPRFLYEPAGANSIVCTFAPGDTVPAGAWVTFRVTGADRLAGRTFEDGLCCDERLDERDPELRYQTRLSIHARDPLGVDTFLETLYSPLAVEDVYAFNVGPFEYVAWGRSADEHGRRDPSGAALGFVGGFTPRVLSVYPPDGASILLRNPEVAGEWPENEVPYEVIPASRIWDPVYNRYVLENVLGSFQIDGAWFRFAPEFVGASHPQEPPPQGVRSWAYEMVGEFDPANEIRHGGGFDTLRLYTDSPELNRWAFVGDDRIGVFVPSLVWTNPEVLDPAGDCPVPEWCDVGGELRANLGAYAFRVRGRSTKGAEVFEQIHPESTPDTGPIEEINLTWLGRQTELVERSLSIRLGIADDNGALATIWPAP